MSDTVETVQKKTAFGYLRVSGIGQVDGDGFARQQAAIEAYCDREGLELVGFFEEKAVSGKLEWGDRPAWMEMMESMNGCRTVVIERLDRLARDLMVQEHILMDLRGRKIELRSTAEPDLGSDDPTRVLMRHILGAVAQYDRAMTVLKLKGARDRQRERTGRCEGQKPFGTMAGREDEKYTLKVMIGLRKGGMTLRDIAEALNRGGHKTRHDGKWFAASVGNILKKNGIE